MTTTDYFWGWCAHRAALQVPEGLELWRIPPKTPELNPSERLWLPIREVISNRCFSQITDYLQGLTNYHWHWLLSTNSQ